MSFEETHLEWHSKATKIAFENVSNQLHLINDTIACLNKIAIENDLFESKEFKALMQFYAPRRDETRKTFEKIAEEYETCGRKYEAFMKLKQTVTEEKKEEKKEESK